MASLSTPSTSNNVSAGSNDGNTGNHRNDVSWIIHLVFENLNQTLVFRLGY